MARPRTGHGVTLFELMVSVVVVGILLALAVPSFNQMFQKNRMKGAAERLVAEVRLARAEALSRRVPVSVSVTAGENWCLGLDEGAIGCDCSIDDAGNVAACTLDGVLRVASVDDFDGVQIQGDDVDATFEPVRGMPTAPVTAWPIIFESAAGQEVGVGLTVLGGVQLCSPAGTGNIWDYPQCN